MLTQNGINYICQNFGDTNSCCVDHGLSWYYTIGGTNTNETGATAQIVGRLALGLLDSLTMTNPARGTFTKAELDAANGEAVTITDAQGITNHDNPNEDQWCYGAVPCSSYADQGSCIAAGCYWCDNVTHKSRRCHIS